MSSNINRTGYAIALVVAVVTLFGSILAVGLYVANNHSWGAGSTVDAQQWRSGLRQGAMMGGRDSMMGGRGTSRGGGMMGNWSGTAMTEEQARQVATDWVAANKPDAQLGTGVQMPIGWLFSVSESATTGSLMVYGNGQVYYHAGYPAAAPSPAPAA